MFFWDVMKPHRTLCVPMSCLACVGFNAALLRRAHHRHQHYHADQQTCCAASSLLCHWLSLASRFFAVLSFREMQLFLLSESHVLNSQSTKLCLIRKTQTIWMNITNSRDPGGKKRTSKR